MKAVICPMSGPPEVLSVVDIVKPEPREGDLLIKVKTSTVTRGDSLLRKLPKNLLKFVGLFAGFKPMGITGVEYSGTIEKVGPNVTKFSYGDEVVGTTTGLEFGANAEFVVVPENPKSGVIVKKPKEVSFNDAAASVVGGMTALQLLKDIEIEKGSNVLVYGASGSVGTFALQIAVYKGGEVTAVCSGKNSSLVKSLGATETIDYQVEDFTKNDKKYDIIIDAVGKIKRRQCKSIMYKGSKFVTVKSLTKETVDDLTEILTLISNNHIKVVIDKSFPLVDIVDAHRYVESGRKKGNIIIEI